MPKNKVIKSKKTKIIVKVYGTETCPWCTVAKDFLKEHKVKFKYLDVGENEKARNDMFLKTGQMGVPVIDINGEILIGFDEDKLKKLLKIKG